MKKQRKVQYKKVLLHVYKETNKRTFTLLIYNRVVQ